MLSQRLARGSALAAQGQAAAFAAVRDSRERFKVNLDALQGGGVMRGATLDPTQDPGAIETLTAHQGALGTHRNRRQAAHRQREEPDVARTGTRRDQPGQQRTARARAAGGAADRPGRRQPARGRLRESAGGAVAADRQERQHARIRRRDRSRSRVPARQGRRRRSATSSTVSRRAATRCASRPFAPTTRGRRSTSSASASARTRRASTRSSPTWRTSSSPSRRRAASTTRPSRC